MVGVYTLELPVDPTVVLGHSALFRGQQGVGHSSGGDALAVVTHAL